VDTIKDVLARFQAVHARVTVDIETDKGSSVSGKFDPFTCRIRCIGLGAKVDDSEVIICVPLRHISGAEWWSTREEKMEVLRALVAFFNDPDIQLVGHNFAFDSSVLLRYNIMRDRRRLYQDTMLMHHDIIDCDLPHDLGFVAARYFEVPSWKGAADDKYYTEVTDHDLQLYNCLMHGTTVVMADGRREPIQNLVRDRSQEKVLSMSPDGRIEARAIVDWHKKRTPNQPWIRFRTDGLSKNSNGLTLTPDHEVFTQRGRVRADQLELGDEIYTSEVKWSKEQRCAALGTLLGDSSLRVSPIFRKRLYEAKTAYIEGSHAKSSNLTPFKVDALSPHLKYTGLTPGGERVIAGIPCKVEDAEKYSSTSLRQLASLVPLIYDENGQRRLRVSVLEALGPIGLAWWYMDDGCRQNGAKAPQWTGGRGGKEYADDSMCFAANRYPRKDIDAAVEWFRLNYGNTIAGKDKIIRLGVVASRKLAQEIAPYICETQRYKLPRHVDYPSYVGFAQTIGQPVMERITEIDAYVPSRDTRTERYKADTSYCITVEGNHNFFTSVGLVKNCRDVLTTMRLDEVLSKEIYKYATTEQYDMDRRLAPIARDMGELGLFVDEAKRGELSKTMNAEAWARYTRLKEITGDPNFNANASRHIQNFLFRVKKLQPEFNSKGEAFQDGEDPSTNANALLALGTKQKLDDETRDFINNLFEYRAYKKLTGTYIDNLQVQYPDWSKHGYDVPLVAPVTGRVYHKFTKTEMRAHHAETGMWSDGRWDETIVIPERPGLSRLYTTYKLHVIPSGRMSTQPACFDGETEILTRRGWLQFASLRPDDEVAQYHWNEGTIDFVVPTAHIAYQYEGEMVRVEGRNLDVLCTPDHKFRFRTRAGRNTVEVEAQDWPASPDMKVPVAGALLDQTNTFEGLSEPELRFLLAAQADGYINSGGYWEFSFTKTRKVEALATTLAALGYKHTVAPKKNGVYTQTRFVVQDSRTSWIDAYLQRDGVEKTFIAEKILSLPALNLSFIADEVMMWDGCATRMNHYSSSNKANADLIQAVHVLVGRAAKVRRYDNARLTKPNWQVDVRAQVEALNCTKRSRVPYSGMVYCVSVPSSMIVVRRNNKPLVTGNCQNWPERGKANMRDMIVAPPGHVIVGADLDQVELRLYASISGDRLLLKAFNTPGMDPHAYNAASLFAKTWGKSLEDAYQHIVTMPDQEEAKAKAMLHADPLCYKQMGYASAEAMLASAHKKGEQNKKKHRNIAKTFVYLETYGGEAEKLYMYMSMARDKATGELMFPGLREEQVHEWHNEWHKHHPETKSWQRTCAQVARVEGYTASPFGCFRKRFYPGGPNKHAAVFNHVIQSECITAMVLTDKGYRTIENIIKDGGRSVVYVRENQWAQAHVIPEGEAPIWRVLTSNGRETEWSKAHRVRKVTNEGYEWTHVCDLKPGDLIAKQPARSLDYGEPYAVEDAYWAGYAIGNGSYSNRTFLFTVGERWHAPLKAQVDRLVAWAEGHGYETQTQWRRKDKKITDRAQSEACSKDEATHALVRVVRGSKLVNDLGLTKGDNCYTKRVPARIWAASLEARKSFLRGFLQADGYIKSPKSKNPACIVNLCNKELIHDLQLFCDLVGIEAVVSGPYKADRKGHLSWRLMLPQNQLHRALGIGRAALERGGELAPMFEAQRFLAVKLPVPPTRAGAEWSRYVLQSRIRNGGSVGLAQLEQMGIEPLYGLTRVVSVEDTGRMEPVYTLSVDHDDHSYVCEGVVSKNSSAAEVANSALLKIAEQIPYGSWSPFTGPCLQVHDYIGVYVPVERAEEAKRIVEEAMCTTVFGIAITASAKVSERWSQQ
jgi:DNA polymerase I-like protein with 3'-5' exonuclease and polymerase domains/intein/homing endonuclease